MSFTVDGVIADLRKEVFGKNATVTSYDAVLLSWLNEIHQYVWFSSRWKFERDTDTTLSLVAAQQEYSIAATVGEILGARMVVSDAQINLVSVEDLIALGYNLEATGSEPDFMWISGYDSATDKIKFKVWPIPTTTRVMSFPNAKVVAQLTAGTSVPLPNDFRALYKLGTKAHAYLDDERPEQAKFYRDWFLSDLDKMRSRYEWPLNEDRSRAITDIPVRSSGPRAPKGYVVTGG